MARRRTPALKAKVEKKAQRKRMEKFSDTIVPKVTAAVPIEVKVVRPAVKCVRCGRTGDGMLCRRCGVVLGHSGQKEARLYMVPVDPTIGY
jgi:RecJ-like exonuclease